RSALCGLGVLCGSFGISPCTTSRMRAVAAIPAFGLIGGACAGLAVPVPHALAYGLMAGAAAGALLALWRERVPWIAGFVVAGLAGGGGLSLAGARGAAP